MPRKVALLVIYCPSIHCFLWLQQGRQWNTSKNTFCFVIDSSTSFPGPRTLLTPTTPRTQSTGCEGGLDLSPGRVSRVKFHPLEFLEKLFELRRTQPFICQSFSGLCPCFLQPSIHCIFGQTPGGFQLFDLRPCDIPTEKYLCLDLVWSYVSLVFSDHKYRAFQRLRIVAILAVRRVYVSFHA
jgi:hypothetical protein